MSEERYHVVGISGWTITGERFGKASTSRPPRTSYSVLDRCDAHREVARFYAGEGSDHEQDWQRRRGAQAEVDRLNALETAEMAEW